MSLRGRSQCAFTVIACQAAGCRPAVEVPVMATLAATIRRCPYGVLVSSGCPLGPILCRAWHGGQRQLPGTIIVIQPCSRTDRQADGPATAVGPVRTQQDLITLCRWLQTGLLDYGALPARLRTVPPSLRCAGLN
jgi:hypothetical protein